jgi:hypothetical protein
VHRTAQSNRINALRTDLKHSNAAKRTESQNQLTPELSPSDTDFRLADDEDTTRSNHAPQPALSKQFEGKMRNG